MAALTDNAIRLANRVLAYAGHEVTHLKLQKLAFYAYGAVLARRLDPDVGCVEFEAWPHGPVSRTLYGKYKGFGTAPLLPEPAPAYSAEVEATIGCTVAVYGLLSAWDLRNQSHLEIPWKDTPQGSPISTESIRAHFSTKFALGKVLIPEYLANRWSLRIDQIPAARFESLETLATALTANGPSSAVTAHAPS